MQNPDDFAKILKPLYGERAAEHFKQLFTDHIVIAGNLVDAAKAGDTAQLEKLRKNWYKNAEDIAAFLAAINSFWNQSKWRSLLFDHLQMIEDEAVSILTGKYKKDIKEYDDIQAQALNMADVMTYGIIRQFRF